MAPDNDSSPNRRFAAGGHGLSSTVMVLGWLTPALSALLIAWLLHFGNLDWSRIDWSKEWAYLSTLQHAVSTGQIPWMLQEEFQGTRRYLANPETLFGPQAVLLAWLSPSAFVLVNMILYGVFGVLAVQRLARELPLDKVTTVAFLALFLLNGHLVAHIEAGHLQWASYFLVPWVFLCMLRLSNGDASRSNAASLALTFAAMVATGGWHVFIWSLIVTMVGCWRHLRQRAFVAAVIGLTAAVTAFRVFPATTVFAYGLYSFESGFPSVGLLVQALIGDAPAAAGMDAFEFDTYIGGIGFAVVVIGLFTAFRGTQQAVRDSLAIPGLVMALLSLHNVYAVTLFRLPAFNSERVSTRLAVVGVLGLSLAGFWQISRLAAARRLYKWLATAGAGILIAQLVVRANLTRATTLAYERAEVGVYALALDEPDPLYAFSVYLGTAISILGITYALWCVRRRQAC